MEKEELGKQIKNARIQHGLLKMPWQINAIFEYWLLNKL